ncbi:DUF932 domain-containing protein [candidate division WWE3 bacterium]|uniref:DUF932 domain-containing protein n=1 Tax=candidate division WWE3 bacterium TaxID=2053526 RepID=A0A3A4ZEN3_UNCKA|nr:MAG: DUF932 domain-containing protein [candidate division WWE3 bacterium]
MRTINDFSTELKELQQRKRDDKSRLADIRMQDGKLFSPKFVEGGDLTLHAGNQLSERLGIPSKYFNLMKERKELGLLDHNVNTWLQKAPDETFFLRGMSNGHLKVRAVLSDMYRIIDNEDVFFCTLDELNNKRCDIEALNLTDDFMTVQFKSQDLMKDVRAGDTVIGGISIRNSEIGLSSVQVIPRIFRIQCTNGMVLEQFKTKQVHLGKGDGGEFESGQVYNQIRLSIRHTFESFGAIVEMMKSSTDWRFDAAKIATVIQNVVTRFNLTEAQKENLLVAWGAEPENTIYGLANTITRAAQSEKSFEGRYALEAIGGQILTTEPKVIYDSVLAV